MRVGFLFQKVDPLHDGPAKGVLGKSVYQVGGIGKKGPPAAEREELVPHLVDEDRVGGGGGLDEGGGLPHFPICILKNHLVTPNGKEHGDLLPDSPEGRGEVEMQEDGYEGGGQKKGQERGIEQSPCPEGEGCEDAGQGKAAGQARGIGEEDEKFVLGIDREFQGKKRREAAEEKEEEEDPIRPFLPQPDPSGMHKEGGQEEIGAEQMENLPPWKGDRSVLLPSGEEDGEEVGESNQKSCCQGRGELPDQEEEGPFRHEPGEEDPSCGGRKNEGAGEEMKVHKPCEAEGGLNSAVLPPFPEDPQNRFEKPYDECAAKRDAVDVVEFCQGRSRPEIPSRGHEPEEIDQEVVIHPTERLPRFVQMKEEDEGSQRIQAEEGAEEAENFFMPLRKDPLGQKLEAGEEGCHRKKVDHHERCEGIKPGKLVKGACIGMKPPVVDGDLARKKGIHWRDAREEDALHDGYVFERVVVGAQMEIRKRGDREEQKEEEECNREKGGSSAVPGDDPWLSSKACEEPSQDRSLQNEEGGGEGASGLVEEDHPPGCDDRGDEEGLGRDAGEVCAAPPGQKEEGEAGKEVDGEEGEGNAYEKGKGRDVSERSEESSQEQEEGEDPPVVFPPARPSFA